MGILDRIYSDQAQQAADKAVRSFEEGRLRRLQDEALAAIIRDWLEKVAQELREELRELHPGSLYVLGDIVLKIELSQRGMEGKVDADNPRLAVASYMVWIMGLDKRSDRLDKLRLGTLMFMTYDGLYKTITTAPVYLDLNAARVLEHQDQLDRFK